MVNTAIETIPNHAWIEVSNNIRKCDRKTPTHVKRFKTRNRQKFIKNLIVTVKLFTWKKRIKECKTRGNN